MRLRKLRPQEIRLLLSVFLCVIFFVATPTSPTDEDACSEPGVGDVLIINNSSDNLYFLVFSEDWSQGVFVNSNSSSAMQDKKPGICVYTIMSMTQWEPGQTYLYHKLLRKGNFIVSADKTTQIVFP